MGAQDLRQARLRQVQAVPNASCDVGERFSVELPLLCQVLLSRHLASLADILMG